VRREVIGGVLSIFVATGCKESRWTPMGSAELVLSEIKIGGAANVAKRIDADESFGRSVMNGIGSGDSTWLVVADRIAPASATTEASLAIALAEALLRAPASVLTLLGPKYPAEEVCGMPFLKADSNAVMAYYDSATKALQTVQSPTLVSARNSCRTALDTARDRRLERINPAYIIKNKPTPVRRRARR
jgi:hypothetical protein